MYSQTIDFKLLFLSMHTFGLRMSKSFLLNLCTFLWSYLSIISPLDYIFTFTCILLLDWVQSWHVYESCLTHPVVVTEQDRVASFSAHWFLILQWLSCSFLEGLVAPLHFLHKLAAAVERFHAHFSSTLPSLHAFLLPIQWKQMTELGVEVFKSQQINTQL